MENEHKKRPDTSPAAESEVAQQELEAWDPEKEREDFAKEALLKIVKTHVGNAAKKWAESLADLALTSGDMELRAGEGYVEAIANDAMENLSKSEKFEEGALKTETLHMLARHELRTHLDQVMVKELNNEQPNEKFVAKLEKLKDELKASPEAGDKKAAM